MVLGRKVVGRATGWGIGDKQFGRKGNQEKGGGIFVGEYWGKSGEMSGGGGGNGRRRLHFRRKGEGVLLKGQVKVLLEEDVRSAQGKKGC